MSVTGKYFNSCNAGNSSWMNTRNLTRFNYSMTLT